MAIAWCVEVYNVFKKTAVVSVPFHRQDMEYRRANMRHTRNDTFTCKRIEEDDAEMHTRNAVTER